LRINDKGAVIDWIDSEPPKIVITDGSGNEATITASELPDYVRALSAAARDEIPAIAYDGVMWETKDFPAIAFALGYFWRTYGLVTDGQ